MRVGIPVSRCVSTYVPVFLSKGLTGSSAFSAARGLWSICAQDARATISSQWEGDLKKEFREYVHSIILLINFYTVLPYSTCATV